MVKVKNRALSLRITLIRVYRFPLPLLGEERWQREALTERSPVAFSITSFESATPIILRNLDGKTAALVLR